MKVIHKSLLAMTLALAGFTFNSCEDGDKVIDEVFANTTSGIVLRTVNIESDELPIGQSDSYFGVVVEMQDEEDGALVESLEVYVQFNDNTVEDGGTDLSTDEALVSTIASSEFTIGEYGFPQYAYSITLPEMLAALPISETDVDGSDTFYVRFEAVMVDGRRFSFADNTDTSTGSFFASPFLYISTVVCPPKAPTAGTWTVDMQDSYGDGWQTSNTAAGDPVTATLNDGTVIEFGLCSPYAASSYACTDGDSSGSTSFEIPAGTDEVEFYFPGDAYGEISMQIYTPNGNLAAEVTPGTAAGVLTINYCVD